MYCGLCNEELEPGNWNDIDGILYCHNSDWTIPGGSCFEKIIISSAPEMEEWLWYGFQCDGCKVDPETGECTCIS